MGSFGSQIPMAYDGLVTLFWSMLLFPSVVKLQFPGHSNAHFKGISSMGTSNNSKGNKDKQKNPKMVHKYLAIATMPHEYLHQLFTWVWKEGRFSEWCCLWDLSLLSFFRDTQLGWLLATSSAWVKLNRVLPKLACNRFRSFWPKNRCSNHYSINSSYILWMEKQRFCIFFLRLFVSQLTMQASLSCINVGQGVK